jgi:hypothetical protein
MYLRNIALRLMRDLGIDERDLDNQWEESNPWLLYQSRRTNIRDALAKLSPQTLGRIAACGTDTGSVSLARVSRCEYLTPTQGGPNMLLAIACMTVAAEMASILLERREAAKQRQTQPASV